MSIAQMIRQNLSLNRRWVWLTTRGMAVGFALAVISPTEEVRADCNCHDFGSGYFKCWTPETECRAGSEECEIECI
jgi:hypothetical protein